MINNFLNNGAVLPSGLLGVSTDAGFAAFKKTYQNCYLRVGIIIQTYNPDDEKNYTKTVTEYDVLAFEQNEDSGSTVITYKNCVMASSFGSIADFFEAKLRKMETKTTKGASPGPAGQNGAIVLLLCLNGLSDRGVILNSLSHPDRKTTLTDDGPHLEGEYNGVHVVVNADGSTSLTFKGATDNDGKIIDPSQGDTVLAIEKDGSYEIKHSKITQRLDKSGKASLTAEGDVATLAGGKFTVQAADNIEFETLGDMKSQSNNLAVTAIGSASLQVQKASVQALSAIEMQAAQIQLEAQAMANIKAPVIVLEGLVSLGGQGGVPVLLMTSQILVYGPTGPMLGTAISGYADKVTAQ